MISELSNDYPRRNRGYWRDDGYAAKLNRAWDVAERLAAESELLRTDLARERARSAELAARVTDLEARLSLVRRAMRPPRRARALQNPPLTG